MLQEEQHDLMGHRRAKLKQLRQQGVAFPNSFKRDALAKDLLTEYEGYNAEQLSSIKKSVKLAGRIMLRRQMGKASFIHLQDMSARIQIYLRQEELPEGVYENFKTWDLGDIIGVEGWIFKTKTNELSIHAQNIFLLTKSLQPLPDKFHGLSDQELRYRQRYVDLIVNEESRQVFQIRSRLITSLRQFFNERNFLEVETPMMQIIPGGAAARPFITRHNALDMQLYLRIAPELNLKRLVVGGFERVYEINRNFRNEGLSTRHNPEFTMLEFYQAYADYHDLINLTEELFRYLANAVLGTTVLNYQNEKYDFGKPFQQMTVKEAIMHYNPTISASEIANREALIKIANQLNITVHDSYGLGRLQIEIFEATVEHLLRQPTFITEYPTEVSPLARCNDDNPAVTDRFELFIGGREIANGFSELNDSEDQAARFLEQVKAKDSGDQEAMHYDADYITALEYGLPPTAGEGIGIDRLAMIFTNSASIRDVILFPYMRTKDS